MRKSYPFLPVTILTGFLLHTRASGQETGSLDTAGLQFLNWYNTSSGSDSIQGVSVDKAYNELLQNKKTTTIIVAVIDGGVDISHEDLQGHIWTNEKEIENNSVDDDHNGYVDDMHGWNFIGGPEGKNVIYENFEATRIVRKLGPQFRDGNVGGNNSDYRVYLSAKKEYDNLVKKYKAEKENVDVIYKGYVIATGNIKAYLQKDSINYNDLKQINTPDEMIMRSRNYLLYLYESGYAGKDLEEIKEINYNHLYYHLNLDYDPRSIVGDNPDKADSKAYGNNDVAGEKAEHGTFVSGIIAGVRNNGKGINGIATDVKIMSLRVVPDGDERDKDVANAIRYAVNNGADIINCSFGKNYSPGKELVDEAVTLAAQKGVIIVHAAGNESTDNDVVQHYPVNRLISGKVISDSWITVGASGMKADKKLVAKFSNYGKKDVDLFAPGEDIYSLHPGNKYNTGDGTSFACPVVTGIIALLKSCYPGLTSFEIRNALMETVTRYPKLKVYLPTEREKPRKKVKFEKLSASGGIVNAYEAAKLIEKRRNKINP